MTTAQQVEIEFRAINQQQHDYVSSTASELLFSGAFGAGKTLALCAKAQQLCLDYPNNFGLICRKTRSSMTHTTIKTFFDLVCPPELKHNYNKNEGLFTYPNGSQIIFAGLDTDTGSGMPLKLGSLNLGFAGIDEAIETTEEDWKMLLGRLRLPNVPHQIFAATNPGPPSHYLYDIFFEQKRGEVYQTSTLDNPELPEDYLELIKTFEGVYYNRYVLGRWEGMEGLVYSTFDERICRVPRMEIPLHWPVYVGHDFGGANPAAMFYAVDPTTGLIWVFAEYLPGAGHSVYDHVQEFKAITEGRTVIKRLGGSHQEDEIRQAYTGQGWPIAEPDPVKVKLDAAILKILGFHKNNRIFVFNDLKEYLKEKLSYAYKKIDGKLTDDIDHKSRFHLLDAERYILSDFTPETVVGRDKRPAGKRYN